MDVDETLCCKFHQFKPLLPSKKQPEFKRSATPGKL